MSRFEEAFIRLSKNIFLILTMLSFFIGVAAALYVATVLLSSPDKIEERASSSLNSYTQVLERKHSEKYKNDSASDDAKDTQNESPSPDNPRLMIVKRIINNINKYAKIVGEEPVKNKDKFITFLNKRLPRVETPHNSIEDVLRNLEGETRELIEMGEKLKLLPITDTRRIYSRDFVTWFFDNLESKLDDIRDKNQQAKEELVSEKSAASMVIPFLPFFIVAFVAFLIFLVFIRIDLGIRKISEHIKRVDKEVFKNTDL
jgi:hypothetical protein